MIDEKKKKVNSVYLWLFILVLISVIYISKPYYSDEYKESRAFVKECQNGCAVQGFNSFVNVSGTEWVCRCFVGSSSTIPKIIEWDLELEFKKINDEIIRNETTRNESIRNASRQEYIDNLSKVI